MSAWAKNGTRQGDRPPLRGLALCGGFGSRLGRDKGTLEYHGRSQAEWLHGLLSGLCEQAFVSIRPEQAELAPYRSLPVIRDRAGVEGPAAGLLAAWDHAPADAWLLVAADLPLVDRRLLEALIERRVAAAHATAFRHADGTPEPLCTIWEPAARARVEAALPSVSLRRVLEGAEMRLVSGGGEKLCSVNTPEDDARVRRVLRARLEEPL